LEKYDAWLEEKEGHEKRQPEKHEGTTAELSQKKITIRSTFILPNS